MCLNCYTTSTLNFLICFWRDPSTTRIVTSDDYFKYGTKWTCEVKPGNRRIKKTGFTYILQHRNQYPNSENLATHAILRCITGVHRSESSSAEPQTRLCNLKREKWRQFWGSSKEPCGIQEMETANKMGRE
jgi:hypothetical protein